MKFRKPFTENPREQLKQSLKPRMANYFQSLQGTYSPRLYEQFFSEDLRTGVMPYGFELGRENNQILATFEGSDEENEKAINLLSDFCEHEPRNETDLICKAVNEISQDVSWEGRAVYEILKGINNKGKAEFYVHQFYRARTIKVPFYKYFQIVPKLDREYLKAKYLSCPVEDVFEITIPSRLGGYKRYKNILNELAKYSGVGPGFFRQDPYQELTKGFDFGDYRRNQMVFGFSITRKWGWNYRNLANEYENEFFKVHKYITFKWAQAILRDHIISELNELLIRLRIDSKFKIEGLLKPSEILEVREKLKNGEIDFEEVFKKLKYQD
ncbi:MAG TPA: hypothetical protein VHE12_03385 [bacterium]|nr:hypothetical protein [bacterium]